LDLTYIKALQNAKYATKVAHCYGKMFVTFQRQKIFPSSFQHLIIIHEGIF